MKQIIITTILAVSTLLYSCQEVIEIDLNRSNPVIVIEGNILYGETANVRLSYTSDYFDIKETNFIVAGNVVLTTSDGQSETLTNLGNGNYEGTEIIGKINVDYEVSVTVENENYQGISSLLWLPELLSIESVEIKTDRLGRGMDNGNNNAKMYNLEFKFTDNPQQNNYYVFQFLKNGEIEEMTYLSFEDQLIANNGLAELTPIMFSFEEGDTATIKIMSVDYETYVYYSQLGDVVGGGIMSSATPYNPQSNFGDKALGYFAAMSIADTTFVVK